MSEIEKFELLKLESYYNFNLQLKKKHVFSSFNKNKT